MSRFKAWAWMLVWLAALVAPNLPTTAEAKDKPRYVLLDIGVEGYEDIVLRAINDRNQIILEASNPLNYDGASFIYHQGVVRKVVNPYGSYAWPVAINNSGDAVGYTYFYPQPEGEGISHAFVLRNGNLIDLGTLGGSTSIAVDINDSGVIVGVSETEDGFDHAFVYQDGRMTDLGTLGGKKSAAAGINNRGQIVGSAQVASGKDHAFLYENGVMTDLGPSGDYEGYANAINDRGQIVGVFPFFVGEDGSYYGHFGFIYDRGCIKAIGFYDYYTVPHDVNEHGHVVGFAGNNWFAGHDGAFYFDGSEMHILMDLVEQDDRAGFTQLESANGVNERGWIVGYGFVDEPRSLTRGFLAVPVEDLELAKARIARIGPILDLLLK